MLQSKTAGFPVTAQPNKTANDQPNYTSHPVDNNSEWYPIEVGAERTNVMGCGGQKLL